MAHQSKGFTNLHAGEEKVRTKKKVFGLPIAMMLMAVAIAAVAIAGNAPPAEAHPAQYHINKGEWKSYWVYPSTSLS